MTAVRLVRHDPHWRVAFESEAAALTEVLGDIAVAIHHIGSTAIPNIYAKPVIDILVEFADVTSLDSLSPEMEAIGYEVMGEFGIPGRHYFRKDNRDGLRTHQVHSFPVGSDQVIRHLAFRDYMTAHSERALAYSELKQKLAAEYPDSMDDYIDGKDAFIKEIDRLAEHWRRGQ